MRWQVGIAGALPHDNTGKFWFVLHLFVNPWVISGIISTFFAGITWMLTMTKFELSYAYPFISLNFVLVLMASVLFFNEDISPKKILGTIIIMIGLMIISKG